MMKNTLRALDVFATASEETYQRLLEAGSRTPFQPGDSIVREGQPFPGLIVVVSGQLKCFRQNAAGKEMIFSLPGKGAIIGFGGVVGRPQARFNVEGRLAGEIASLDFDAVRATLREDGDFALLMFDYLERHAAAMQRLADEFSLLDAHTRLALWLVEWISANLMPEGERFNAVLPFTQAEIAAQIGTVREVISRVFTRMKRERLLAASGKRLEILSWSGLKKVAQAGE